MRMIHLQCLWHFSSTLWHFYWDKRTLLICSRSPYYVAYSFSCVHMSFLQDFFYADPFFTLTYLYGGSCMAYPSRSRSRDQNSLEFETVVVSAYETKLRDVCKHIVVNNICTEVWATRDKLQQCDVIHVWQEQMNNAYIQNKQLKGAN